MSPDEPQTEPVEPLPYRPVARQQLGLSTGMRWTILVFLMVVIIAIVGGIFDQPKQVAIPANCPAPTTTTSAPPQ